MMLEKLKNKIFSSGKDLGLMAASICGMGAIMICIGSLVVWILQKFYGVEFGLDYPPVLRRMFMPPLWILFIKFLLVGFAEEGLFRSFIQEGILSKLCRLPNILSLSIASAIFGAAHLMNAPIPYSLPQSIGAAFGGILLGTIFRKKGLHFAALTHGLYDFLVTVAWFYGVI